MLIAICDDQIKDCACLTAYCQRFQEIYHIQVEVIEFANAGALLKSKKARSADVIFLDIYLENANGVDAARMLRNKGYTGAIIFTTISEEHYAQGYEVAAIHYLLKPITWETFIEAMHRLPINNRLFSTIQVKTEGVNLDIAKDQIIYIEVLGHKTILYTKKSSITLKESLSALELMLGGDPFLRCYRYFIINMDHVVRLKEDGFLMSNEHLVPISRDGQKEIKKHYLSYLFTKAEVSL